MKPTLKFPGCGKIVRAESRMRSRKAGTNEGTAVNICAQLQKCSLQTTLMFVPFLHLFNFRLLLDTTKLRCMSSDNRNYVFPNVGWTVSEIF